MNYTTRTEVRKIFKSLGYKVSFVRNPFNSSLCNIAFKNEAMLKPCVVSASNCYPSDFRENHKDVFEESLNLKGFYLSDTDQKIV